MRTPRWLLNFVFCQHNNLTRPFTDKPTHQLYKVCLDCGRRIHYEMPVAITDHPYLHEQPVEG